MIPLILPFYDKNVHSKIKTMISECEIGAENGINMAPFLLTKGKVL
jgi:hypothetical protein